MANRKISQLDSTVLLTGDEMVAIVQPVDDPKDNKKVTLDQISDYIIALVPPSISTVATDGVTIQGDGSIGDPIAIKSGYLTKSVVGLGNVDNTSDVNKPVSTAQAAADAAVLASANAYSDGLVVGLWDDRGNFNASVNAYPSSGGSGTAGAILKGDVWTVSVAGTLPTGQVVEIGDIVRAIVDTPGNTQANWSIQQNNIGYTAENSANKTNTVSGNESSTSLYLSVKGYYDYLIGMTWLTSTIWGTWIVGLTGKTTPVDADTVTISDSAASNAAKKVTWANIKATLFDSPFINWIWNFVSESGTSRTFLLSDAGKSIHCSNSSTVTLTIPTNASIAYPIGTRLRFKRTGSGTVVIAPAGGVTFQTPDATNLSIRKQYGFIEAVKIATDTWDIIHTPASWWEFAKTQTATITAQWIITGTDNSSATYAFIVKNLAGDVIFQCRNDQAAEFGGTSFLLEVNTGIATGNARFRVNGNIASAMVCEDKDGQEYWEIRSTTGDKAMIFKSIVEQNQGLGFTRVIKQFYLRLPNQTAGASHIVDQISIPSDTVVQISIDNFSAVATDGATVELVAGHQSIVRNIAGTTSKAATTYTVLGNPATTATLAVVANNTDDRADLTFTNTTGTGKDFEVYGSVSYILKAVPV